MNTSEDTQYIFEVGDLVNIHFARSGDHEAIVVDRDLWEPGPIGGPVLKLLFSTDGEDVATIWLPDRSPSVTLIESGYGVPIYEATEEKIPVLGIAQA